MRRCTLPFSPFATPNPNPIQMWASALQRCRVARNGIALLKPAYTLHSVVPKRQKWSLAKRSSRNLAKKGQLIMEEQKANTQSPQGVIELKHFLRTRDLPTDARLWHLRTKLAELVELSVEHDWANEYFTTIDAVFSHFYRENGTLDYLIPKEQLFLLFDKTAVYYLETGKPDMPQYMAIMAQEFIQNSISVPTSVLINMAEIGSTARLGGLSASLSYVLGSRDMPVKPDFTASLLERQAQKGPLNLDTYDAILTAAESLKQNNIINDAFVRSFIRHIQEVFADSNPKIHEYLDTNKSLHRIQYLANKTINEFLKVANTEDLLRLLKLKAELNSVHVSEGDSEALDTLLMHLQAHGEHDQFVSLQRVLFAQDIHDETLAESLLSQAAKGMGQFDSLLSSICDFVSSDEIKFSPTLRLKSFLWKASLKHCDESHEEVFTVIKKIYDSFAAKSENPSNELSAVLHASSDFQINNTQQLLDLINQDFASNLGVEPCIIDYKTMIDCAIRDNKRDLAYLLFEESIQGSTVHWAESVDPSIASTLDKLAFLIMQTDASIVEIFPHFKILKQHMPASCSANALYALIQKMLAEACVGDVIELMRRELPAIEKDSYLKIRTDLPYCGPYKDLFYLLHNFVVSYKEDTSFETNWVLYGELHKYFHIPAETYLPVIEAFCEAGRLNAALLIARRMKMLSELHADSNINPPPPREIYTYLLRVFGDQLYEEGVVEIHEFLKMDTNLETQDIDLQNAILNAYSNLQNIGKARDLFLTISSNPKQQGGINEETAQIMLKTYTYSGLPYVKKFWNNLSLYGIYPDYGIFKQYLIAHTYHGNIEGAIKLVNEIDDYNLEFSSDLLLSMHNFCIEPSKQAELVDWASKHHKEEWEKLIGGGLLKSATAYMPEANLIAGQKE